MSVYEIIEELRADNGSNYKMDVLRKHSDNELLKRVLKMAYDKATFTYGVSMKNVPIQEAHLGTMSMEQALNLIESELAPRNVTGHAAIDLLARIMNELSYMDSLAFSGVIGRDLKINMGRSNINKVFKGLIVKPIYMRCSLFTEKTRGKINPEGSFVQLKADGTYREFIYDGQTVECNSRSGEEYDYPDINAEIMANGKPGVYHGELTVYEDGRLLNRAVGNGIIKKNNFEGYFLKLDLWDYITLEEYNDVSNKKKATTPYHKRFAALDEMFPKREGGYMVETIETHRVNSVAEALQHVQRWMEMGLEGGIWKDKDALFRDGTSAQQQKLKLEIDADVRITGYKPGSVGTKREGKIGSIEFATDDGKVKGFASGFTAAQLDEMSDNWDDYLGKIMALTCSDITQGRDNDYFALSHPRFNEVRTDKTETDTLERILETKAMAMQLS